MNETTAAGAIWPPSPQHSAQPPYPYSVRTSGYAIASLVLGIVWLGGLGSFLAVIFGHLSYKEIRHSHGQIGGRGLATAGLVLGYIGFAGLMLMMAVFMIAAASVPAGSYS